MLHKAPEEKILNQKVVGLHQSYIKIKKTGANLERVRLIRLIQSFSHSVEKNYHYPALLGICVYGLLKLNSGKMHYFYGEKNKNQFHFFGSELVKLLQECLDIHFTNSLDDQHACVYLVSLYHHIKKYPRNKQGEMLNCNESDELLNEISEMIKSILNSLSEKRPSYRALLNNFETIPEQYHDLGGKDFMHDRYAHFLKILNYDLKQKIYVEQEEDKEWTNAYLIRYAALLFMMEKIESSYSVCSPGGGWLTNGSQLYKVCQKALNIYHGTKHIPNEMKRKYYIDLLSYLMRINLQPKEYEVWEKQYSFPKAHVFLEELQMELAEKVVELMKVAKPGAVSLSYVDVLTSMAASYGVSIVLGGIAKQMHLHGTVLTYFNLLKPEVALLITLLTYSMNSVISQKASSAVNKVIINTVSTPVVITFNSVEKFGKFCSSLFVTERGKKSMEITDFPEFTEALQNLPPTIFLPALKEKMHYISAYDVKEEKEEKRNPSCLLIKNSLKV